ncbi:hypothetical protein BBJ28_00018095 [Nothophytophthora sp. Chile5]|nr:hypothetical protein BBJ28_00018095 [Nothophytophthora sp. Chile5]
MDTLRLAFELLQDVGSGKGGTTLTKWYIQEGEEVKDGAQIPATKDSLRDCVSDCLSHWHLHTIDCNRSSHCCLLLCDRSLVVAEGTHDVAPGQPLAIIVPTEAEIEPFVSALKENPHCIEGYVEPTEATPVLGAESTEPTAPPTESAASSDVLRVLHKLQKEGRFEDEKLLKVLKSLARKNDDQLLTTYKGSFADGVLEEAAFDKDFFVENALELAEEALQQAATGKVE